VVPPSDKVSNLVFRLENQPRPPHLIGTSLTHWHQFP